MTGCADRTVNEMVRGTYLAHGSNHGKPVYKREGVLIYFWDDRDGETYNGWWFGPKVGGDQVWAYNANKASPMAPQSGWQVPWDGQVDSSLKLNVSLKRP